MLIAPTPLFLLVASPLADPAAGPGLPASESTYTNTVLPSDLFEPEPFALESAALEAVLGPTAMQASTRKRNRSAAWSPEWVLTFGTYMVEGDYDTFNGRSADEDLTYGLDFVIYNWDDDVGVGLEFGLMYGTYSVPTTEAFGTDDEVDVFRGLVGVRVADRGIDDPTYIPYVRGGGLYRSDDGGKSTGSSLETIRGSDQDGFGWYVGGGIDFRIGSHVALTPSVMFTNVAAYNAEDWIFGLQLSVGY